MSQRFYHKTRPNASDTKRSAALKQLIIQELAHHGGKLDFAQYMHLVLYSEFGYYNAKEHIFGEQGDYITAPELSHLFSKCLADQCQQILSALPNSDVIEFGAGTGIMAKSILLALDAAHCLPSKYYIIEPSKNLCDLQYKTCQSLPKKLRDKIEWVNDMPHNFRGVILANEMLDAMPVHRFRIDEQHIFEYFVIQNDKTDFDWHLQEITSGELYEECTKIRTRYLTGVSHYSSECNLIVKQFLRMIFNKMIEGVFIMIDYGYPEMEYYHPERAQGTLTCFYQHQHHDNPFLNIGMQDITAHVNFSLIAREAERIGYKIAGYTNQAAFLLNCNLLEKLRDAENQLNTRQQVKTLIMPTEMGELIKVMAATKNFSESLLGFKTFNKILI